MFQLIDSVKSVSKSDLEGFRLSAASFSAGGFAILVPSAWAGVRHDDFQMTSSMTSAPEN